MCMKLFFMYSKYYSVTDMLTELRLPSFDTLIYNSRFVTYNGGLDPLVANDFNFI